MPTRRMPHWSVRVRILAAILVVTAVAMVTAGASAYFVQRERILDEIDDRLNTSVEAVRLVVTGSDPAGGVDSQTTAPEASGFSTTRSAIEAVLARVLPSRNESSLGLLNGVPTFVSAVPTDFQLEDDPAFIVRVTSETSDGSIRLGTALTTVGDLRYIAVPIDVAGTPDAGLYVTAYDIEAELADMNAAFRTYAMIAAVSLLAIGLVGWFVAGRLLRPIRQVSAAASRITASDLSGRIPVSGNDDVSALTSTVNDMLERLDRSITTQHQLLSDVRHELKTPLTIVRGHLELMNPDDPAEVRQTVPLLLDELDRMTGLVDEIAALADSQEGVLQLKWVDVDDFSDQVFAKASAIGNHDWRLAESATIVASLDPVRITQAWLQLADNAAKYSPPGSPIALGSRLPDPHTLEFFVTDRGPGIPEGMEERIFERFGRVDARRGIQGSGLGLPIVSAIARAHGGRVTLQTSPSGSRFAIVVPVNQEVK
ncbi:ATP-binding protein [Diaminobutyricimonas sp. LJ205]|uniref:sensor histidine kinase n=1 Tax=Diaminobutyricimonas sp. LJ205 TaxID=2683590 RepID=UPI0018E055C1|nr:ATP-binding protein [Diaminobutyricimonas sp. LJ205]